MKIDTYVNAGGSRYETPALKVIEIMTEGMICSASEETNADIEDFELENRLEMVKLEVWS